MKFQEYPIITQLTPLELNPSIYVQDRKPSQNSMKHSLCLNEKFTLFSYNVFETLNEAL